MRSGKVCVCVALCSFTAVADPAGWDEWVRQGKALQNAGRFAEAAASFAGALKEAERLPDQTSLKAATFYRLADLNIDMGRPNEAARYYEQALSILAKTVSEDDPQLQTIRIDLAALYLESGQDGTAEKLIRHIMATQRRTLQTVSIPAVRALDVLAGMYIARRKLATGEKLVRQTLAVLDMLPGEDRLLMAVANLHLAMILDAERRAAEGLPYAVRAEQEFEQLPDAPRFLMAQSSMALASLYISTGRNEEAERSSLRAVELMESFYGMDHPQTGSILLAHAAVLRRLGRKQQAKALQQQGARIVAEQKGRDRLGDIVPLTALLPTR